MNPENAPVESPQQPPQPSNPQLQPPTQQQTIPPAPQPPQNYNPSPLLSPSTPNNGNSVNNAINANNHSQPLATSAIPAIFLGFVILFFLLAVAAYAFLR